jgi:hypothetical protein
MNTIKKTTLIAAITAMVAFAVPSMASAAVWGPLNTNKTLTSTPGSSAKYIASNVPAYTFECKNSTLGVHVRTPASSTLDVTSASFTGCVTPNYGGCNPIVTATGLPWAATTSGSNVTFTEHLQVVYGGPCGGLTVQVDGRIVGSYSTATHTFSGAGSGPPQMTLSYNGWWWSDIYGGYVTTWQDATNTLTLI